MSNEMVEFQSNGQTARGYLSVPEAGQGPGVIVLQEWWGLNAQLKGVADRFAAEGFVALAPDLYHGESADAPDKAGKLMMELNIAETEKDLRGAVEYLLQDDRVTSARVGTVGFCMGGMLSLYAATQNRQVGACVVFYGIHPKINPDLEKLQAPVLGFYAERDQSVPPSAVRQLESKLKELGKQVEIYIYEGTEHAFFNEQRPEVYDPQAAEDAWRRTIDFYRQHLTAK